jgi:peptidoglycan/LPS O-acetylase OafA/YrhL
MKRIAFASGHAGMLNHPDALAYSFPDLSEVLATLTFSQGMGVFDHLILNTPSWSISVEFYTYLVFAFICLWANGKAQNLLFCLFSIAGFLVSVWASSTVHNCLNEGGCLSLTYDFGYARSVFSFFFGALLCRANPITPSQKIAAQALGIALLFLIFTGMASMPPLAFMAPAAFGLLIASMQKDAGILAGLLKSRPLQILGQRSFSIYLMHMPLLLFFENIAKRTQGVLPSVLVLAAYAGSVVWVSGFTYRFIENPMRIRFNRIASQLLASQESPTLLRVEK